MSESLLRRLSPRRQPRVVQVLKKALLPKGYPDTVSDDYLAYQAWDSVQAFASSIMNNLATQAVFRGVGVGDSNATVLAATITWIVKDGTSMIGSLVFATMQSSRMDSDCKRWRLFADLLNDLAISVDLLSSGLGWPYFPLAQCVSGLLRSLVGIAGGATRAALTQHQAICNNTADVSAKDNSQERMVNLFALACSLLVIPAVSDNATLTWLLVVLFMLLHVYANYRAVKCVSMRVFNASRLAIFLERFLHKAPGRSLSVEEINRAENVWVIHTRDPHDRAFQGVRFHFGESESGDPPESVKALSKHSGYRIVEYESGRVKVVIEHLKASDILHGQRKENTLLVVRILLRIYLLRSESHCRGSDECASLWPHLLARMEENQWNLSYLLLAEMFDTDQVECNEDASKQD